MVATILEKTIVGEHSFVIDDITHRYVNESYPNPNLTQR